MQAGPLTDGLGNRDLPLAGDSHTDPSWPSKNLTGDSGVIPKTTAWFRFTSAGVA
jgi:hypothetical protein